MSSVFDGLHIWQGTINFSKLYREKLYEENLLNLASP